MIIIAFSQKTSKILPRIFCRYFRHCAPIAPSEGHFIIHQFVRCGHVVEIPITARELRRLRAAGWRFIYLPKQISPVTQAARTITCVAFTKRAIGLRAAYIQTPDALYKHLLK